MQQLTQNERLQIYREEKARIERGEGYITPERKVIIALVLAIVLTWAYILHLLMFW